MDGQVGACYHYEKLDSQRSCNLKAMDNGMRKLPVIHDGVNLYKPVNDCEMDIIMRAPTRSDFSYY